MTAIAVGLAADRLLGEPPDALHPVVAFGRAMQVVERRLNRPGLSARRARAAGVAHAAVGVGLGVGAGWATGSPMVAAYLTVAGRMLTDLAGEVGDALVAGELDRARALLPALVGRDPSALDEREVARAVIESVAENTVDAVVAPALWAVVAGAPGAFAHRAVNTMDAMVGHRSPRYATYGTASARLDDVMAWVPARVTAALVAAVRPGAAAQVWRSVRRDAPAHPSPNAGVAEAAFAAALGIRLGGEVRYGDRVEHRPTLGAGPPACPADIARATRLAAEVTAALAAILCVVPTPAARTRRRR